MEERILIVDDQTSKVELPEQFGVEAEVRRARHNPMVMSAMLAYALLGENKMPIFDFNDGSPDIRTYGSKAVKNFSPDEWKQQRREQGRNELCNCGSGKKYKKCCALSA